MKQYRPAIRQIMIFRHGVCEINDDQFDALEAEHTCLLPLIEQTSELILKMRSNFGEVPYADSTSWFTKEYKEQIAWWENVGGEGNVYTNDELLDIMKAIYNKVKFAKPKPERICETCTHFEFYCSDKLENYGRCHKVTSEGYTNRIEHKSGWCEHWEYLGPIPNRPGWRCE